MHDLGLVVQLAAPDPAAAGLAEVRRAVEALLNRDLSAWRDERVAVVGTGRAEPTPDEVEGLDGTDIPAFT